jgi:hypothetical protein
MYYLRIKGLDPLNFGRKKGCGANVIQPKPMLPIGQLVQNQYPIKILTSRLEKSVLIAKGILIQQIMAATLPVNIHFTIGVHVYGNGVPIQQPKKVN